MEIPLEIEINVRCVAQVLKAFIRLSVVGMSRIVEMMHAYKISVKMAEPTITREDNMKSMSSMKRVSVQDSSSRGPVSQKKWLMLLDLQKDNLLIWMTGQMTERNPHNQQARTILAHTLPVMMV